MLSGDENEGTFKGALAGFPGWITVPYKHHKEIIDVL